MIIVYAVNSKMSLEYCGTIKYCSIQFDVYWNSRTKDVYASNVKHITLFNTLGNAISETKENALKVAHEILKKAFMIGLNKTPRCLPTLK
jgi:hypothetical protein